MFHDVRMRGFRRRADVEEVQAWIDGWAIEARLEDVALDDAAGRVLANALTSGVNVPTFARAAMDGWAVRGEDTFGAAETDPLMLEVVGTSLPGRPHEETVRPGQAVRIMTGAAVPDGADTILRAEDGHQEGGDLSVRAAVAIGRHVGAPGEDILAGRKVLPRGRRLRPQDLGVASSIGYPTLRVHARPGVHLIVTGDEVLPAGRVATGTCIVDANAPMLRALVRRDGGCVTGFEMLPDDATTIEVAMRAARADVLLVTGGSSVGQEDHAPRLLDALGELCWHGVGLRPAAPAGAGSIGEMAVFLLPGNPVSCLCAYDFFAGRLVRRMAGRAPAWPYAVRRGVLTRKIASVLGRVDYVRVRMVGEGVAPLMARGASILSSTTEADGFVIVPRDHEGWPPGHEVDVHLYDVLQ